MATLHSGRGAFAAFTLSLLLAACGGGGGGEAPGPVAPAPTTTTTASPAAPAPAAPAPVAPAPALAAPAPAPAPAPAATAPADPAPAAPTPATSTAPAATANVLAIRFDQGTDGSAINSPFVSVTVCVPGTQACQTIDHVLVDTGSAGLRLTAAALRGLALPAVNAPSGAALAECASFASGYTWGSVRRADVRLAGERAGAIPVQVIDDGAAPYGTVPAACSNTGPQLGDGGSNGILGVGFATQDCGAACATSALPGMYFACGAGGCSSVAAPLASQVINPVAAFDGPNNNGVAIVVPPVGLGGVAALEGSLVFGIGTRENNQLGSLGIYNADRSGNFTTSYKGRSSSAFIDSGSNGIFFADGTITRCASGFYCPSATLQLSATVAGTNGASRSVPFSVESVATLPGATAAAHLGGGAILGTSFDWGLPFFFGRTVFVALGGMNTPAGLGPFWAF